MVLTGSAQLRTLIRGTVPLRGDLRFSGLNLGAGTFQADLALAPTQASLVALGFLPVKADLAFVPAAPVTGTLTDQSLSARAKVRIKLPKITLFGLALGGGSTCQTRLPSSIPLSSAAGAPFELATGGALSGTFSISDLTGCGALTGIVSPLTAGAGNAVAVQLTPKG